MASKTSNPATRADAGRARELSCWQADVSENNSAPSQFQSRVVVADAIVRFPARSAQRDGELIAADAVLEAAIVLAREAEALREAASAAHLPATEIQLWKCKRVLAFACRTWREVVPARSSGGDCNG
jgi:hypothetical protein